MRRGFHPHSAPSLPHHELSFLIGEWRAGEQPPAKKMALPVLLNPLPPIFYLCWGSEGTALSPSSSPPGQLSHWPAHPCPLPSPEKAFQCSRKQAPNEESRRRRWHRTPVLLLENPMDGGAWWAAVHGVAKSRTRLSDFTFPFMHWRRKWQPTPVFLPGESQGQGSLVG